MSDFTEIELREIIRGCISNDRIAQEKLYKHFYKKMSALVRTYIKCPYKTEEVLNNGYLRAFKKIEQYDFKGSFEGWLRKIVFHAVSDYVKSEKLNQKNLVVTTDPSMVDFRKSFPVEKNNGYTEMCYAEILRMVDSLPKATSTVFHLYVYEGYTHIQISRMLDISEGTSKWHLSKGKELLREKIIKLGLNVEV